MLRAGSTEPGSRLKGSRSNVISHRFLAEVLVLGDGIYGAVPV